MPKLLFYYWFEPNCLRKYVTDLRLIFKIGSPTGIDDNDCCEIELRIAIAQGTLPWQPIFVYSIHTFFSSQWSMCNTLCAFSHDALDRPIRVIHEGDRRPQRFLLTTPIHRETDPACRDWNHVPASIHSWERTFPLWTSPLVFSPDTCVRRDTTRSASAALHVGDNYLTNLTINRRWGG